MIVIDADTIEDLARAGTGSVFVALRGLAVGDVLILRERHTRRTLEVRVDDIGASEDGAALIGVSVYDGGFNAQR